MLIDGLANEKSIEISHDTINLRGTISPVRLQKDPYYIELRNQMEKDMELTGKYRDLRREYESTRQTRIEEGRA